MTLVMIGLILASLAAFCLRAGLGLRPGLSFWLKPASWLLLALSLTAGVQAEGWTSGLATWFGLVTLGGLTIILVLAIRPRIVPTLGLLGLVAALARIVTMAAR